MMNKKSLILRILFTALALALLGTAFLPGDIALAESQSPLVRFTVINNSQHPFSIYLYGPETHDIVVEPYSTSLYFVTRGTYSFFMEACNHTKSGKLDLTIYQNMYVPVCGGNSGAKGDKPHNIDVADYIKMVKVTIRNKTREPIHLYFRTLENHYYLDLAPREITYLIVPKDTYVYSYVACGELQAGYYQSLVRVPLDLKCSDK